MGIGVETDGTDTTAATDRETVPELASEKIGTVCRASEPGIHPRAAGTEEQ